MVSRYISDLSMSDLSAQPPLPPDAQDASLFLRGRKLGAEDLQVVLLALLAQAPSHGYQLIKQLAEHSEGFYEPSPGMVYPALASLTAAGLASAEATAGRKRYQLTPAGTQRLSEVHERAHTILDVLRRTGTRMAQVRRVFEGGDGAEVFAPGTHEDLMLARYGLKRAVHARAASCTPQEAVRIAAILRRATTEILDDTPGET
ncbi:Transcriptional regulator, PadR family [plant metagenome]|uniref:Transcriptional regulator, PadR family n=2 Tax=plant metagenome TaxID=1297885 RepID=A0A484PEN5_9ZZZZ